MGPQGKAPREVTDEIRVIALDTEIIHRCRAVCLCQAFDRRQFFVVADEQIPRLQFVGWDPALPQHIEGVFGSGLDHLSAGLQFKHDPREFEDRVYRTGPDGFRPPMFGAGENGIPDLELFDRFAARGCQQGSARHEAGVVQKRKQFLCLRWPRSCGFWRGRE